MQSKNIWLGKRQKTKRDFQVCFLLAGTHIWVCHMITWQFPGCSLFLNESSDESSETKDNVTSAMSHTHRDTYSVIEGTRRKAPHFDMPSLHKNIKPHISDLRTRVTLISVNERRERHRGREVSGINRNDSVIPWMTNSCILGRHHPYLQTKVSLG